MLISGPRKLGYTLKRHLRRRAAVEPEIGHMKKEGLLGRNFLKGMKGDAMNAVLCGVGHNLRKILARAMFGLCEWAAAPSQGAWYPPSPRPSAKGRLRPPLFIEQPNNLPGACDGERGFLRSTNVSFFTT